MSRPRPVRRIRNLALAAVAAQAGCWVIVVVIIALLAGLWLDAQMGRRGPFTIGLVILSIPVSLFLVFRIVLRLIASIDPPTQDEQHTDTSTRGG